MPISINVIKYLVPAALGFMLGFYLAENVTTKVYSKQIEDINTKHELVVKDLETRIKTLIENENALADKLNAASSALAEANLAASASSRLDTQKALVKYKNKIVLVDKPCTLSAPSIEYIKDNIAGK
jgi:hypothetical protein